MKRSSHDLSGIASRIAKLGDSLDWQGQEVASSWKDDVGREFMQRHILPVRPQINQLISELAVTIEQFEAIARQLQDPELR